MSIVLNICVESKKFISRVKRLRVSCFEIYLQKLKSLDGTSELAQLRCWQRPFAVLDEDNADLIITLHCVDAG